MREETEQKVDGVTKAAELVPDMADLLHYLKQQGHRLALVADTRVGTYRNVLNQHGLFELFDAFAISDEVCAEKPDRRIFLHALDRLGIPQGDWNRVVMVGNNLARDVRGANDLGLISVWMVWNPDYPTEASAREEEPLFQVCTAEQLERLLVALHSNADVAAFAYPQPFPWL